MDGYQANFSTKLRDELESDIVELSEKLSLAPAADHSGYMRRVGFIEGLRRALNKANEIESKLTRPEGEKPVADAKPHRSYED